MAAGRSRRRWTEAGRRSISLSRSRAGAQYNVYSSYISYTLSNECEMNPCPSTCVATTRRGGELKDSLSSARCRSLLRCGVCSIVAKEKLDIGNFTKKNSTTPLLEKECKSIILDKETLEVVCYTYDDIFYNQDAKDYILQNELTEYSASSTLVSCRKIQVTSDKSAEFKRSNPTWNYSTRQQTNC